MRNSLSGLLPTSAECFVELHDGQKFLQANAGQVELRLKEVAIGIQRIELRVDASAIAHVREAHPVFQRGHKRRLLLAALSYSLVGDQGIGDFGERGLYRLLVSNQRALPLGLRELDAGLDPAGGEDGLGDLRRRGSRPCVRR